MTDEIITGVEGRCGRIRLNRPKALNALTPQMCLAMIDVLQRWADDPAVAGVMIDHAEGRGFCAGGDIVTLAHSCKTDGVEARNFLATEFHLNHLLYTYAKPTIAFMDGVTMGGGVGISRPCKFRVATERTSFAMPETAIGYVPDIGSGRYLSRLPGRLGQYIALTGARLDGSECLAVQIATHGLQSADIEGAKEVILETPEAADAILDLESDLDTGDGAKQLLANQERIDRLFASDDLAEIERRLETDGSDWARERLAQIRTKSPTSGKVALRLLHESLSIDDFADQMRLEYTIASRMIGRPDFVEGVRALLIEKTNDPRWQPASAQAVDDALVDSLFEPLPPAEAWTPLSTEVQHGI